MVSRVHQPTENKFGKANIALGTVATGVPAMIRWDWGQNVHLTSLFIIIGR